MHNYKQMFQEKSWENERNYKKFTLLCQWMRLKNQGVSLAEFFMDWGIKSIAIYGMGEIGELLFEELMREAPSLVKYAIDQSGTCEIPDLPVYRLQKGIPSVEAVIITPVLVTDAIEDEIYAVLGEQTTFVFEELLYELSRKHGIKPDMWSV